MRRGVGKNPTKMGNKQTGVRRNPGIPGAGFTFAAAKRLKNTEIKDKFIH